VAGKAVVELPEQATLADHLVGDDLKGAAPELEMKDINVIQNLAVVLVRLFPELARWLPRVLYG
jgi:hypothetical protein